jgi:hypothetical protein
MFSAAFASDDEAARRGRSMEHETSRGEQKENMFLSPDSADIKKVLLDFHRRSFLRMILLCNGVPRLASVHHEGFFTFE